MRESLEYDVQDFEDQNAMSEKGVYAKFYYVPTKNEAASAAEGRAIFEDKEFVEIIAAGNSTNIIRRPARKMDTDRFRRQYAMFKEGDSEQMIGTPLTEIPWITRSQVEELAYKKIRSLEDLASLSDGAINAPGMYDLKRKASAWLEKSKESAPFTAMQAELEAMRAEIAALKAVPKVANAKS